MPTDPVRIAEVRDWLGRALPGEAEGTRTLAGDVYEAIAATLPPEASP